MCDAATTVTEFAMDRAGKTKPINLPSPRPRTIKVNITGNTNQVKELESILIRVSPFLTRPSPTGWMGEEINGGNTTVALVSEYHWTYANSGHHYSHLVACQLIGKGHLKFFALYKTAPNGPFSARPTPSAWGKDLFVYPEWREGLNCKQAKAFVTQAYRDAFRKYLQEMSHTGDEFPATNSVGDQTEESTLVGRVADVSGPEVAQLLQKMLAEQKEVVVQQAEQDVRWLKMFIELLDVWRPEFPSDLSLDHMVDVVREFTESKEGLVKSLNIPSADDDANGEEDDDGNDSYADDEKEDELHDLNFLV